MTAATAQATARNAAQAVVSSIGFGAPELKFNYRRFFKKALYIALGMHVVVIGGIKLANYIVAQRAERQEVHLARFKVLAPPPSLSQAPPPPVALPQTVVPPTVGLPTPVPDAQAPQEQTIATQEEIQQFNPNAEAGTGSEGDLIIAEKSEDETPAFGEFVYYEEPPVRISMPPPRYPDLAREAGLEGTVRVQALIGKDGSVRDVRVVKSIQMLDDAAVQSVRRSVWKPALNNNKPVAVWVEIPVKFSLN